MTERLRPMSAPASLKQSRPGPAIECGCSPRRPHRRPDRPVHPPGRPVPARHHLGRGAGDPRLADAPPDKSPCRAAGARRRDQHGCHGRRDPGDGVVRHLPGRPRGHLDHRTGERGSTRRSPAGEGGRGPRPRPGRGLDGTCRPRRGDGGPTAHPVAHPGVLRPRRGSARSIVQSLVMVFLLYYLFRDHRRSWIGSASCCRCRGPRATSCSREPATRSRDPLCHGGHEPHRRDPLRLPVPGGGPAGPLAVGRGPVRPEPLPVLGAGMVWFPAAVYLAMTGRWLGPPPWSGGGCLRRSSWTTCSTRDSSGIGCGCTRCRP